MSSIIQRPGNVEFCATMPDYIIDTDNTITFEVQYAGSTILSESYVPDKNYQVRVRNLGHFCRLALWGIWPTNATTSQSSVAGTFSFLIDGVKDAATYVLFSRQKTKKSPSGGGWLSELQKKVTRAGMVEYATIYLPEVKPLYIEATNLSGSTDSVMIYNGTGIMTFEVGLDIVKSRFPALGEIVSYRVYAGDDELKFLVDRSGYPVTHCFRCKNVYDVPETVGTVGALTLKGNNESDTGVMYEIERKFAVKVTDEYTAASGRIFLQSDYKLWHNFVNAQEAGILIDGAWYDIVVTGQTFEREMNKTALKEVEFTFRMANPEENNLIN